jgi:hypothetical protein
VIRSLESSIASITSSLQQTGRDIAQAQQQLDAAKRKYGAPFPEEAQLNDAIAERNQLQSEMAAETKAKDDAAKTPAQHLVSDEAAAIAPENIEAFKGNLEKQLRRILPNDSVALRVLDTLVANDGIRSNGMYHPWLRMITVAADSQRPRLDPGSRVRSRAALARPVHQGGVEPAGRICLDEGRSGTG